MQNFRVKICLIWASLGWVLAQNQKTSLKRQSLEEYPLALCNDGSAAAYYHDLSPSNGSGRKVLIYLPNDPLPCSSAKDCERKCQIDSDSCTSPKQEILEKKDSIFSTESQNNPFATYSKVFLPSCSSDEFSGTRGKSASTKDIFFHGHHIFGSLLKDLVARFGIHEAAEVVLVGSGSGARGVARSCDFLTDSFKSVSDTTNIKCVLDGADFYPYWVTSDETCPDQDLQSRLEDEKLLWGRQDDDSCIEKYKNKLNSTYLSAVCGTFSRFWKEVSTPLFIINTQLNQEQFGQVTCGVGVTDDDYQDYAIGWRQGMLSLVEAMSVVKPQNGWFIPNCDLVPTFLDEQHSKERRSVKVDLFDSDSEEKVNVLQVISSAASITLNNWIKRGSDHQAADAFGVPNDACQAKKSLPLDLRPETFLPELIGEAKEDEELRKRPAVIKGDGNIRNRFIGRFLPPSDLFPDSYQSAFYHQGLGGSAFGGRRADGFSPAVVDQIFDYDDLNLGFDFDFAVRHGGIAIPGLDPALPHGRVPVAAGTGVVAGPHPVRGPRPVGRPHLVGRVHPIERVHTPRRRASLWRKLHYLEYLRHLYQRHYREYYHEYYGSGRPAIHARLQKKEDETTNFEKFEKLKLE